MSAASGLRGLVRTLMRHLRPRRRVPAGSSRRFPGEEGRRRDDGGAGVREPLRPSPTPPSAAAAAEPRPEQFLDLPRG